MKRIPLILVAVLLMAVFFGIAVPLQAQHTGICTMDCATEDIRPSGYAPQQGQVPVTRSLPPHQRGHGGVSSPGVASGPTTAVQGSSSYTYTVPIRFAAPGRGPDPSLTLFYNSHIWFPDAVGGMMLGWERDVPSLGMALNFGFLEWNPSPNGPAGILTTPDGAKHPLSTDVMNLVPQPGPPPNNLWYVCANQTCLYDSDDSTYIHVSRPMGTFNGQVCQGPNNCAAKDSTVTYKNGTVAVYQSFAVVTNDIFDEFVMRPYHIQDANGNYIDIVYANANDLSISSITDSLGRTINFFYNGSQLSCVTDGTSCNASGSRTYNFHWTNLAVNFNFTTSAQLLSGGNLSNVSSGFTLPVVSSVCRPDNSCVQFNYGDWGIVNDIQELSANGTVRYELSYDFPAAAAGALSANPSYTHQVEKVNGQTNTWTYAVNTDPTTGVPTSTSVTDPLGTTTTTTFSANGDWADGLSTQVQTTIPGPISSAPCAGCPVPPTVVQTRSLSWTSDLEEAASGITNGGTQTGVNPRPSSITTTLDDGSQSQVTFQYDNSVRPMTGGATTPFTGSGSVTDKVETDFGSGAPGSVIRETVIQYASLPNHILGLPTDVQVKSGSGKVISHMVMAYDGATLQNVSPLPVGHDNVNYSATSTVPRGNLTTSTAYADPAGNTGGVTTTFTYDILGHKVAEQDGCCTQTAWNYSNTTAFGYPDSVVLGPAGNQLTTTYSYYQNTGLIASITDWNGQGTTFNYDSSSRLISSKGPDAVTHTVSYDDNAANPSVSQSSTANSLVGVHTIDFRGRTLSDQTLNGTTVVSTISNVNDALGRPVQVSNPYAPGDTQVYTTYAYDWMGRTIQITPPAASQGVGQNSYTNVFSGPTKLSTDPAGQQAKQYSNSLGQLVRVDVPGPSGGAVASVSIVLTGTEQSVASNSSQNGATAGMANISVSGSERSTQVLTHPATHATGSVTINGSEQSFQNCPPPPCQPPMICCLARPWWKFNEPLAVDTDTPATQCVTVYDSGTVSITVGGFTVTASYGSGSTGGTIAAALASALNASNSPVTASASGTVVYLTSKATGVAANLALASSSATGDPGDFGGASFSGSNAAALSGGTDNAYTTMYDTGNLTVSFVVPGITPSPSVQVSETVSYGQNDTPTTLAQALANKFSTDSNATPYVTANASNGQLALVTTATGAGTNYAITLQSATTSQYFASASTSFPLSGPSAFAPGATGILYDAGTITATLNGFGSGSAPTETVNYSQGSTAAALAASLVAKINGDSKVSGALTANVPSGSSTITITAADPGAVGNRYSISLTGTSKYPSSFPTASFASPTVSAQLAGGADPSLSLSTPTITAATYDPYGRPLQVSVGQQTQTYVYDGLGRMTSVVVPETAGNAVQYTYTDFGAIAKKIDPRMVSGTSTPITTTYGYDSLNRVTSITYNDNLTPNVTYTYNAPNAANNTGGRLASVSNSVETKAYQYDVVGRLLQCLETIAGKQYAINYVYGADGQPTSVTYPSGLKMSYSYDAIGRLQQVGTPTQTILSVNSGGYNAAGMPLTVPYGNSVIGSFAYNNRLQMTSLQYGKPAPVAPLLSLSYLYGGATNNGQIQGITDNVDATRSTSYQYDVLGRLRMAQTVNLTSPNSWQLTFTDDIYNNRLAETPTGGAGPMPSSSVVVDPVTNRIQINGAVYDAVGNMVSDGISNDVFDANNHLTTSTPIPGSGATASTFAYGPDGKLVNRNGTVYIYSGRQAIAEYPNGAAAGSPSVEYINLAGRQVASIAVGTIVWNYTDHLSTRLTSDKNGNTVSTRGHFPYGELWYQTGPASDFLFTTYRRDGNSGLDYADARQYSPRLGRFMSPDPLLGGSYVYANSDPINMVDPTGLAPNDGGDGGTPCTTNPFDMRILPLCGPDQLGGAVGGGQNCGITFGDSLSFDISFGSNCNGFTVNFNDSRTNGPFGSYQDTLRNILGIILPIDTCPGGTFECPADGNPLFGLPTCDPRWCVSDYQGKPIQQWTDQSGNCTGYAYVNNPYHGTPCQQGYHRFSTFDCVGKQRGKGECCSGLLDVFKNDPVMVGYSQRHPGSYYYAYGGPAEMQLSAWGDWCEKDAPAPAPTPTPTPTPSLWERFKKWISNL
jgi:RHS repeat-associated protein